jgi:hypothetical protein
MLKPLFLACAATCLAAACSPSPSTDGAATETATKTESADGQGAADSALCKLFTAAEIEKFLGKPVNAGTAAGPMNNSCQWVAKDDSGDAMLTVVAAEYADNPTLAEGYQELPALGEKAYVAKDFGGYVAGAIEGADFIKVTIGGDNVGQPAALAFLQEALNKHP